MKKESLLVYVVVVFMIACQAEFSPQPSQNQSDLIGTGSIKLNNNSYPVQYAYLEIDTVHPVGYSINGLVYLSISNLPPDKYIRHLATNIPTPYNGNVSAMGVIFMYSKSPTIPTGSFSFEGYDKTEFSKSKHFIDGYANVNIPVVVGSLQRNKTNSFLMEYNTVWNTQRISYLKPSTVSITKGNDGKYSITYSIKFSHDPDYTQNTLITGNYSGPVNIVYTKK